MNSLSPPATTCMLVTISPVLFIKKPLPNPESPSNLTTDGRVIDAISSTSSFFELIEARAISYLGLFHSFVSFWNNSFKFFIVSSPIGINLSAKPLFGIALICKLIDYYCDTILEFYIQI